MPATTKWVNEMGQRARIGPWLAAATTGCTFAVLTVRMAMPADAVLLESHVSIEPAVNVVQTRSTASMRGQSSVLLSVPSIAVIRVDADGNVMAAMTNTGSAPSATDELWSMPPDGSMHHATADEFSTQRWIGDFSEPGVYVDQRG